MEISSITSDINKYKELEMDITNNLELLIEYKDDLEEDIYNDIDNSYSDIESRLSSLEVSTLLNGEFDKDNCYLEIHPGAGGTEAQDWASMLLRMYQMYLDKNGYKYEMVGWY